MAILTISREFGSGGEEIGRAVAKLLGYEYINKETILSDISKAGRRWEEWAKDLDEHYPTLWEKYDWSFRGLCALIQSHILVHSLQDKVVIMGRGGNFLLKDIPHSLRIKVVAPLPNRVERVMLRESIDRESSQWLIEKTDNERACFIHAVYHKHWNDPKHYDMLFDTSTKRIDEIVNIVKNSLMDRERFNTEETRRTLEGRAIAAKVKAGILTNPAFFLPTLDVSYDGQALVLRGVIHKPKEHKEIEEEAKKIAPQLPIRCELHYRIRRG